ncbi:DUF3077 domain-containing protein [Pseudomonas sp. LF19]|uniref:DUF3077 domain-containing protein n=1 Tax=Pseudomonas sp. LF19 TaxID=2899115 RepID=UPI003FA3853F
MLMGCAQKLTSQTSIDQDTTSVWAVHYRVGMAKALVDDLAHGLVASAEGWICFLLVQVDLAVTAQRGRAIRALQRSRQRFATIPLG